MTELEWQKFNAKLRVAMIILLIGLGALVVYQGMSPCDKCKFIDTRCGMGDNGNPDNYKEGGACRRDVTCTEIMTEYAYQVVDKENLPWEEQARRSVDGAMAEKYFNSNETWQQK